MVSEVVKVLEDEIRKWLDKDDILTELLMMKHLRLKHPNRELERDISYEIKKRERRG